MNWRKIGHIFSPTGEWDWMASHAAVPFIGKVEGNVARVYFSSRNSINKSVVCAVDINLDTFEVLNVLDKPLFEPGIIGYFDCDGVMGSHITEIEGTPMLYYIGWNLGLNIPFRNAIGVAKQNGDIFERIYQGPILDRSIYDPCFVASNCIHKIDDQYIMYYLSCIKWEMHGNELCHFYNIKIATSKDGFKWDLTGKTAIDFRYENEYAISSPRVIYEVGIYKMWYSYRGGYKAETYRIGYAESEDGHNWIRKDESINLEVSSSGWDSEMLCYPYIFDYNKNRYMLYNGNGYGKTGFGVAVLEK